jgi:hypothetical protein
MLNLPISVNKKLDAATNILVVGAGGGSDILCGLPLYYTFLKQGKKVHLANLTHTDFKTINEHAETVVLDANVLGATSTIKVPSANYVEGYLSQYFKAALNEDKIVWMINRASVQELKKSFERLVDHLKIDAIVLVDGGVDSIMHGDEDGSGTMFEDTLTLAATKDIQVPKILACIGFGTEVEEGLNHYRALENVSNIIKQGGFYGNCSLVDYMNSFKFYKLACEYVWRQPGHKKSHISTRIIPAAQGEFGNVHVYAGEDEPTVEVCISPLMNLYWFFEADAAVYNNQIITHIESIPTLYETIQAAVPRIKQIKTRSREPFPYL